MMQRNKSGRGDPPVMYTMTNTTENINLLLHARTVMNQKEKHETFTGTYFRETKPVDFCFCDLVSDKFEQTSVWKKSPLQKAHQISMYYCHKYVNQWKRTKHVAKYCAFDRVNLCVANE